MNRIGFVLIIIFSQSFVIAQKTSPIEYIEAGKMIIDIFRKDARINEDNTCTQSMCFENNYNESLEILIFEVNQDSVIRKLTAPKNTKNCIYSLDAGIYKFAIKFEKGELIRETEFILKRCEDFYIKVK